MELFDSGVAGRSDADDKGAKEPDEKSASRELFTLPHGRLSGGASMEFRAAREE